MALTKPTIPRLNSFTLKEFTTLRLTRDNLTRPKRFRPFSPAQFFLVQAIDNVSFSNILPVQFDASVAQW
jgi:hypothetical protein